MLESPGCVSGARVGRGIRSANEAGQQAQCLQQGRPRRPARERKETMRPSISVGALVAVTTPLVAGLATGQPKGPAEVVEERQQLMKRNGDAWKNIQDNAKAGNWAVVAANAEIISKNAAKIPSLFPEGSLTDKSKAKPEIWQKW